MNTLLRALAGSLVITFFSFGASAQAIWTDYVDTSQSAGARRVVTPEPARYYVLQLKTPQKKHGLQQAGIELIRLLDERHAIIRFAKPVHKPGGAHEFFPANNYWKLSPALYAAFTRNQPVPEDAFIVSVRDVAAFRKKTEQLNGTITVQTIYPAANLLIIHCAGNILFEKLLPLPELTFADYANQTVRAESVLTDADLTVNTINQVHHEYPELTGAGITVSVKDNRYQTDDLDLRGRHVPTQLEASGISQHATNMATLIAGAGNSSPKSKGVLPGSRLASSDFSRLLPDPDAYFTTHGIPVQNHSYGTTIENYYGVQAQAYDVHTRQNPDVLHVFSAGNSGLATDTQGVYKNLPGVANLTGNFKMAKNILTIGAVDTAKTIEQQVSKGPAYDGRVKPELVAYSASGSSGAAAIVSGTGGLLQQAYRQQHDKLPPAALLKAMLLNSAEDVGPEGPDYQSGYGNVDARQALATLRNQDYVAGSLSQDEKISFTVSLPANAQRFKATLVWHDPAAQPNAASALVNDLDLIVANETSGERYFPWVLNAYPNTDSLQLPPTRRPDHLNNVEQVSIETVEPGTYTITVSAYDVPEGSQDFYVAYEWEEKDSFRWTHPTGSDYLPNADEQTGTFRWQSTFTGQTGRLEYRLNNGEWTRINDAVDLTKGYYNWTVPDTLATATARMTIGGQRFVTDTFVVSQPLKPSVGFNCADSVMLQWNRLPGAASYALYTVGEQYLEPVTETVDTFVVLQKSAYPSPLYAVAPRTGSGKSGVRSQTFDYTLQGVDCYIASFLTALEEDGVALNLTLGTTYAVNRITFERVSKSGVIPVHTIEPATTASVSHTDTSAAEGLNVYQARIRLANGQELVTPPDSVYFLTDSPYLVFPNPVRAGGELRIYANTLSQPLPEFTLYNLQGQPVFRETIQTERAIIPLSTVVPGLYFYVLSSNGSRRTGKLIVQ